MSADHQPTEFERQRELLIREIALVRALPSHHFLFTLDRNKF